MKLFLGVLLVFGSVLGGFAAMDGNLWVLWQPWEIVIIVGAALGAFIISNTKSVIFETVHAISDLSKGKPHNKEEYLELLSLLYMVFKQGKSNLQKLEKDLDRPEDSDFFNSFSFVSRNPKNARFIADYLRLVLLGSQKSHEMESLLDEELDTMEAEAARVPNALMSMADSLPAIGIIAAVLGIIKAMGAIAEPPEILAMQIGGALVGTFLGVFLSYGFVGPLASAIKTRREHEMAYYIAIKSSIIAFLNGYQPQICVEYARKVISSEIRPEFEEVEDVSNSVSISVGLKS
jgi:chemotaxis protein MotA